MSTSTHDLFDFFKKANSNISDEYTRICRRVNEDPETAGDIKEKKTGKNFWNLGFHLIFK